MAKGQTSENLECAILQIVMGPNSKEGTHEDSWGCWETSVRRLVTNDPFTEGDLKSAFKRLRTRGIVTLEKCDSHRGCYREYSGDKEDDVEFFLRIAFRATITDDGRSYWDKLRVAKPVGPIGFVTR
ncbi:MAG: hypothetical protein WBL61_01745 [Bryobacteraceae bacterium]